MFLILKIIFIMQFAIRDLEIINLNPGYFPNKQTLGLSFKAHKWKLPTSSFSGKNNSTDYKPMRAPNTKRTQPMTQASIAVRPSALGIFVVIVLKMLTRTRKIVIRSVILEKFYLNFQKLFKMFELKTV